MSNHNDARYTIDDLSGLTDVPVRTIRYYIAQGLLPGATARGKGASYGEEHLTRLQLIRRLVERRVPLAEIRSRLAHVSSEEADGLLRQEERTAADARVAEGSPADYIAHLLDRAREARRTPSEDVSIAYSLASPAVRPPSAPALRQMPAEPDKPVPSAARDLSWRRVELAPGLELHVRADAERRERGLIDEIVRLARVVRSRRPLRS